MSFGMFTLYYYAEFEKVKASIYFAWNDVQGGEKRMESNNNSNNNNSNNRLHLWKILKYFRYILN